METRRNVLTWWQILFVINQPEVYKSPNSNTYMCVHPRPPNPP